MKKYNTTIEADVLRVDSLGTMNTLHNMPRVPRHEGLLFIMFLFYGTGINSYNVTDISLIIMSGLGLGYFLLFKREQVDSIFWKILAYWLGVNFFSWAFVSNPDFAVTTLVGSMLKLFIGFIFIKIFREKFILWFERSIYILLLISLPFYLVQLYDVTLLTRLPFNFVAPERALNGDWNGIIFNFQPLHHNQNAGFAGEPGTFGYYIGLAALFNLYLNEGKFTRRFFTFLILGLTTISTNYYLSVMMFASFWLLNSKGMLKYAAIVMCVPILYVVFQLPFLGDKIDDMIGFTNRFTDKAIIKYTRVNRFAYFLSQWGAIIKYPFGYGINENGMLVRNLYGQVIEGTNGISRMGVRFGIFGFFFFFTVLYKFIQRLMRFNTGVFILFIIVTMYLGANPMERDYFISALFWMYFIVPKEHLSALQQRYALKKRPFAAIVPNLS